MTIQEAATTINEAAKRVAAYWAAAHAHGSDATDLIGYLVDVSEETGEDSGMVQTLIQNELKTLIEDEVYNFVFPVYEWK